MDKDVKEYNKTMKHLSYKSGVYLFYNKDKVLLYVGKSETNLARRIRTSKGSIHGDVVSWLRYVLVDRLSDVSIVELYYISRLKPPFNKDYKFHDKSRFDFESPYEESDFIKIPRMTSGGIDLRFFKESFINTYGSGQYNVINDEEGVLEDFCLNVLIEYFKQE